MVFSLFPEISPAEEEPVRPPEAAHREGEGHVCHLTENPDTERSAGEGCAPTSPKSVPFRPLGLVVSVLCMLYLFLRSGSPKDK